ncbi:MAG: HPF/RaiA family ribosome-associated protein [Candidatus Paceibacterota bacterium]
MAFPIINFKFTNTETDEKLQDLASSKFDALQKFIGDAPAICEVEFEKVTNHRQQGSIHRVEINLEVNGKLYRAESTSDTFEKALDEVKAEVEESLRRARGKEDTMLKKGGRKLKQLLRWGR